MINHLKYFSHMTLIFAISCDSLPQCCFSHGFLASVSILPWIPLSCLRSSGRRFNPLIHIIDIRNLFRKLMRLQLKKAATLNGIVLKKRVIIHSALNIYYCQIAIALLSSTVSCRMTLISLTLANIHVGIVIQLVDIIKNSKGPSMLP